MINPFGRFDVLFLGTDFIWKDSKEIQKGLLQNNLFCNLSIPISMACLSDKNDFGLYNGRKHKFPIFLGQNPPNLVQNQQHLSKILSQTLDQTLKIW